MLQCSNTNCVASSFGTFCLFFSMLIMSFSVLSGNIILSFVRSLGVYPVFILKTMLLLKVVLIFLFLQ